MASPGPIRMFLPQRMSKLAANGPVKKEPANRRVRGILNGVCVFDTLQAEYVWEHPYFPVFWIPIADIEAGPGELEWGPVEGKGFWLGMLYVEGCDISIAGFKQGPLNGLALIRPEDMDAWYAEDERLLGSHPKDPYKRIDCLSSSREVRIKVDGVLVARSTNNVFLHETGLRPRYYLSPTSILDWSMLSYSKSSTICPYKGEASYYHPKVGGKVIEDAIWYYKYPTTESAPIQNRLCFYNEKVDVFVDGVKEE